MPNIKLLLKQFKSPLLKAIQRSNKKWFDEGGQESRTKELPNGKKETTIGQAKDMDTK
ncbi:MAG: hypothetical protein JRL30_25915 [Deltaproteobacteria bacterium]|nr:hypothetical protein [Deltaproteobacteria bacterium]